MPQNAYLPNLAPTPLPLRSQGSGSEDTRNTVRVPNALKRARTSSEKPSKKKKRKTGGTAANIEAANVPFDENHSFVAECRLKGTWITLAIMFGLDISDIFSKGMQREVNLQLGQPASAGVAEPEFHGICGGSSNSAQHQYHEQQELYYQAYDDILAFIPELRKYLPIQDDTKAAEYQLLLKEIQRGCGDGRTNAVRRVKLKALEYLKNAGPVPYADANIDTIPSRKGLRGFNHPSTGRLLCPGWRVTKWDQNAARIIHTIASGDFSLNGANFPLLCFEGYRVNEDDPEDGLFRSPYLVTCLIDLLFGPTSVDVKASTLLPKFKKRSEATGNKFKCARITPPMVGFTALMARFVLSSEETWSGIEGRFNYYEFYNSIVVTNSLLVPAQAVTIVNMLSAKDDPWAHDTMEWWNKQVFGSETGRIIDGAPSQEDNKDPRWAEMLARRAMRSITASEIHESGRERHISSSSASTSGTGTTWHSGETVDSPPSAWDEQEHDNTWDVPSPPLPTMIDPALQATSAQPTSMPMPVPTSALTPMPTPTPAATLTQILAPTPTPAPILPGADLAPVFSFAPATPATAALPMPTATRFVPPASSVPVPPFAPASTTTSAPPGAFAPGQLAVEQVAPPAPTPALAPTPTLMAPSAPGSVPSLVPMPIHGTLSNATTLASAPAFVPTPALVSSATTSLVAASALSATPQLALSTASAPAFAFYSPLSQATALAVPAPPITAPPPAYQQPPGGPHGNPFPPPPALANTMPSEAAITKKTKKRTPGRAAVAARPVAPPRLTQSQAAGAPSADAQPS
ncbi:hypothetical protein BC834DRAFT_974986 [Gloeopeniophorella convolvens]|nr:hypothetical protein BC834DRAFT_974986 [Gloeopeniophorella convolvens]